MATQLKQDTIEKATKPVIIEAFASWCPHCTKMRPIFDELEKEFGQKYIFAEFDVDEFENFTSQFNITSLPTFIFINDKEEIGREVGEMPPDQLKKHIENYLKS